MKLSRSSPFLTLIGVCSIVSVLATEDHCVAYTKSNDCSDTPGCTWENNNPAHCHETHEHIPCTSRSSQTCETDDLCIGSKVKGVFTCQEVNLGKGLDGNPCQYVLVSDDDGDYYAEVPEMGCSAGYICDYSNATNVGYNVTMYGECQPTDCIGKKVPGNCNGNYDSTKDQCEATTQRVTICHRTCSEKNPWVRITIDEDAWSGEECGHQQHNVTAPCADKAPWAAWGPNRTDYLLRFHGTRAEAATKYGLSTPNQVKTYWRRWEPACPWVRHGECCTWNSTDNPCCGIPPEQIPTPRPTVAPTSAPSPPPSNTPTPRPTPAPTVPPTPAPTKCPYEMGETDETICPGYDAVGTMAVKTQSGSIYPPRMDPSNMFYDIEFGGTPESPEVSFKLDSPFEYKVDVYVQYHKHPEDSTGGGLDPACIGMPQEASCNPDAPSIKVGCIKPMDDKPAFSLVTIFFRDDQGTTGTVPYACCPVPAADVGKPMIEYTFKVLCECPDGTSRNLRRVDVVSDDTMELWQNAMLSSQ